MKIDGPRACTKAELPEVIALVDAELGRRGTGQTILTDYPLVYEDRNLENIRILKVDGELASVVPFIVWPIDYQGCRFSMAIISPTATAPAHRKKGYGRRCLQDCIGRMTALGCELSILRTKVETFPFYETEDYHAVDNQAWIYRCTREDAGRFLHHGEDIVIPNRPRAEQMAAIRAMHEADGGGSARAAERYPAQFSLPRMKTLLAYRGTSLLAYLVVSEAANVPGLVEAGGDEAAIESLVHRAISELSGDGARVAHVNLNPSAFAKVLEKRLPGRRQPTMENRMVRLNEPARFFRKIAPWLERVNRAWAAEKLETLLALSRRQLVAAVFGAHRSYGPERAPSSAGLPHYYFPVWLLDRS